MGLFDIVPDSQCDGNYVNSNVKSVHRTCNMIDPTDSTPADMKYSTSMLHFSQVFVSFSTQFPRSDVGDVDPPEHPRNQVTRKPPTKQLQTISGVNSNGTDFVCSARWNTERKREYVSVSGVRWVRKLLFLFLLSVMLQETAAIALPTGQPTGQPSSEMHCSIGGYINKTACSLVPAGVYT